jgi:predicted dehydrogenase
VHLDYNQRPSAHTLEVVGSQGVLRWDNSSGAVRLEQMHAEAGSTMDYPLPQGFERNDLFLAEMRNFMSMTRGEGPPACTLDDGIHALRLALAARQSAETGKLIKLAL